MSSTPTHKTAKPTTQLKYNRYLLILEMNIAYFQTPLQPELSLHMQHTWQTRAHELLGGREGGGGGGVQNNRVGLTPQIQSG